MKGSPGFQDPRGSQGDKVWTEDPEPLESQAVEGCQERTADQVQWAPQEMQERVEERGFLDKMGTQARLELVGSQGEKGFQVPMACQERMVFQGVKAYLVYEEEMETMAETVFLGE